MKGNWFHNYSISLLFCTFLRILELYAAASFSFYFFCNKEKYLLMVKGSNFLTFWIILLLTLWAVLSLSAFHFPIWSLYVCTKLGWRVDLIETFNIIKNLHENIKQKMYYCCTFCVLKKDLKKSQNQFGLNPRVRRMGKILIFCYPDHCLSWVFPISTIFFN